MINTNSALSSNSVGGQGVDDQRKMNVVKSINDYILDMVESVSGVKVLILDEFTKDIISVVVPFSLIMQKNVFLVDTLQNEARQSLKNMKAIVYVRPTNGNVELLKAELVNPKYQSYNICRFSKTFNVLLVGKDFSNVISQHLLEKLASSDKNDLVKGVFEYFTDYLALDKSIFSLNIPSTISMLNNSWDDLNFRKIIDGLSSSLISLKKRPTIRFQQSSDICKKIATELSEKISTNSHDNGVFDFKMDYETRYHSKAPPQPIVLIIDRRDDPITPLLMQWTYQAMIHELIGLKNNVIKYPSTEREEVFSSQYDEFFSNNMYENWGDLCKNVKQVVEIYQENHNMKESIQSIEDLAKFMQNFPSFKKQQQETEKHVSMVTELRSIVAKRKLFDISEVEQEIVCGKNHNDNFEALKDILNRENTTKKDALRLVILYALRYEDNTENIRALKSILRRSGIENTGLVDCAIEYGGRAKRTKGLFDEAPTSISFKELFKKVASEFKDKEVSNVFTQHKPRLYDTLDQLFKGRLSLTDYPFMGLTSREVPQEVIVFIVGGITYEEASTVELFNNKSRRERDEEQKSKANFGVISSLNQIDDNFKSVTLGGTTILNSTNFLKELERLHEND